MTKRLYIIISMLFLLTFITPAEAQKVRYADEVGVFAGGNFPFYSSSQNDALMGIYYGHTYYNGLGVRFGLQYAPSLANVDNYFGIPVALTYKTGRRTARQRIETAADVAHSTIGYYNYAASPSDILASFLFNLFSNWEFSLGATPGYIAGSSSGGTYHWTEKAYSPSLLLDAGIGLNFNIWRFDLKLLPAIHYNLTNNLITHDYNTTENVRWIFTLSGGLAFNF